MKNFTTIHNHKVVYYSYHDTKKPTILMIHGITGNHKGFQYFIPELKDFRVIVPDLPGFGNSDVPPESAWSVDGLARLTNQFVKSLELAEPPIILGHSMGGLIVASMINQAPKLYAKKVVLISPVPTKVKLLDKRSIGVGLGQAQYQLSKLPGKVGDKIFKSKLIADGMSRVMMKTEDPSRQAQIYYHHRDNLEYFSDANFYQKLHWSINRSGAIDYKDALKNKQVLLIAGDKDNVEPLTEMNKLADAINPDSYEIIKGVGHLIHYEKPTKATELIKDFLTK